MFHSVGFHLLYAEEEETKPITTQAIYSAVSWMLWINNINICNCLVYVLQTKLQLPKCLSKLICMYLSMSVCFMCFSPSVNLNQAEVWPRFRSLVENTRCELCRFGLDFSLLCDNSQPVPLSSLFFQIVNIQYSIFNSIHKKFGFSSDRLDHHNPPAPKFWILGNLMKLGC